MTYLDIATYGFLMALLVRNIWVILYQLKEYKNIPLLAFYVFATISLSFRLVYLICYWSGNVILYNMS